MNRRIALVTGGNRGIGLEVVRELAQKGLQVVLTARSEEAGRTALVQLSREGYAVDFQKMDVTRPQEIEAVAGILDRQYGKLDILINNAGILEEQDDRVLAVSLQTLESTLRTNTLGPLLVSQRMAPLLRKGDQARIINVSSGYGELSDMEGGRPAAYKMSKAALNAITLMLADELRPDGIAVDSVCPGWVRTDMGGQEAPRSVEQGAAGIVWLALAEKEVPTGQFLRDGQAIPW